MTETFTIDHYGEKTLSVRTTSYESGGLAVQLIDCSDGAPYARVSLFIAGVRLALDEFVFKTYSENKGLLEGMVAAGIVEETGRFAQAGLAGSLPICRLLGHYPALFKPHKREGE